MPASLTQDKGPFRPAPVCALVPIPDAVWNVLHPSSSQCESAAGFRSQPSAKHPPVSPGSPTIPTFLSTHFLLPFTFCLPVSHLSSSVTMVICVHFPPWTLLAPTTIVWHHTVCITIFLLKIIMRPFDADFAPPRSFGYFS